MTERLHGEIQLHDGCMLMVDENCDRDYPGISIILIPADDPYQTGEDNREEYYFYNKKLCKLGLSAKDYMDAGNKAYLMRLITRDDRR